MEFSRSSNQIIIIGFLFVHYNLNDKHKIMYWGYTVYVQYTVPVSNYLYHVSLAGGQDLYHISLALHCRIGLVSCIASSALQDRTCIMHR